MNDVAPAHALALDLGAPATNFALISDIHSNLHALEAVLHALDGLGVADIYCLGDVVGYNAFPEECAQLVRQRCDAVVMGNHDWASTVGTPRGFNPMGAAGVRHTRRHISDETRQWLSGLPVSASGRGSTLAMSLYHGSPTDPLHTYVFPSTAPGVLASAAPRLRGDTPHLIALGHTHAPMALIDPGNDNGPGNGDGSGNSGAGNEGHDDADVRDHTGAATLRLKGAAPVALVNPGSVGQPRDGDPRAAFAIVDATAGEVRFHRVAYDVEAAVDAVREARLPRDIGDRLLIGK